VISESIQIWTAEPFSCLLILICIELTWYVYKWIVDIFTRFLKCLGPLDLDAWDSSYGFLKWVVELCLNLDRIYVQHWLTFQNAESCCDGNIKGVENIISFPESPSLLFLDEYLVSYEENKWLLCCCPENLHVLNWLLCVILVWLGRISQFLILDWCLAYEVFIEMPCYIWLIHFLLNVCSRL
jgi:hypothetical protein